MDQQHEMWRPIFGVANIIFLPFPPFPPYFTILASQMKSPEKKKARKSTTQVIVVFVKLITSPPKRHILSVIDSRCVKAI